MEQLNRVELRGNVGMTRVSEYSGKHILRMSVATNLAYKAQDGSAVIETTWHTVSMWTDDEKILSIQKGDKVEVVGRIRNQRYTTADGSDRYAVEIVAKSVNIIDEQMMFATD